MTIIASIKGLTDVSKFLEVDFQNYKNGHEVMNKEVEKLASSVAGTTQTQRHNHRVSNT